METEVFRYFPSMLISDKKVKNYLFMKYKKKHTKLSVSGENI